MQEEEKQKRKAELTSNYEAKVAARREMKEARLGENVDEDGMYMKTSRE